MPRHILAIRFSSLGDIAMTVPVIKNVLAQNPDLHISFLSVDFVKPLFEGIDRLHFYGINLAQYKGLPGLHKLAGKMRKEISFDAVADLHNVLRTKILKVFLRSKMTASLDKGRREKEKLTQPENKIMLPLKTTFQRYADVFTTLGIQVTLNNKTGISQLKPNPALLNFDTDNKRVLIGFAPFAKHRAKMYPLHKTEAVIEMLIRNGNIKILIFGNKNEFGLLNKSISHAPAVFNVSGKYTFTEELNIISQLDVMISMDSANMHLASLYGIPVVSVWGGTHPFLGFGGWAQHAQNIIQTDLPCRPSSVFGNKDCPVHGARGCMQNVTPKIIAERVSSVLRNI